VEKLRHDVSRIRQNQTDSYAAFDFFVTAEHVLDRKYLGRANRQNREDLRASSPLTRVTSHLASGAKHFKVEASHHTAVDAIDKQPGIFDPELFDPAFFDSGCLVVDLAGEDARVLGDKITVLALADRVLRYWEDQVASR
jgi:hypothetical protein